MLVSNGYVWTENEKQKNRKKKMLLHVYSHHRFDQFVFIWAQVLIRHKSKERSEKLNDKLLNELLSIIIFQYWTELVTWIVLESQSYLIQLEYC